MLENDEVQGGRGTVVVLMVLVLLWSGALRAGFAWAAATGSETMGLGRTAAFYLVAAFLGALAAHTGYELVRRLRRG